MKDYYNLELLRPIKDNELIGLSRKSKASLTGTITVWGDCIGRPWDSIYSLKEISWRSELEILFEFKGAKIYIYNPRGIYVNEMIIAIKDCDSVIWDDISFDTKIQYDVDQSGQKLGTKVLRGSHKPKGDINEPCFMLATW